MKKWFVVLSAVLVLSLAGLFGCNATTGSAQGLPSDLKVSLQNQQEGIWVSGTGKVTVTPDVATLGLGVEAQAATVASAQAQAVEAMNKVMSALTNNGVASKDIQTRYFNISQLTRWDAGKQQEVVVGYRVANSVTARIRQLDKVGAIIDAVALAGGDLTRINSLGFTVDDPTTYNNQLREKAMADAKMKAEQLASLGGVQLGKPTYISESGAPTLPPPMPIGRGAEGATTPISPGELDLSLSVQVVYSILS